MNTATLSSKSYKSAQSSSFGALVRELYAATPLSILISVLRSA